MRHRVGFWFSYCAARAVDSHRCPPKAPKENPGAGRGFVRRAIRWISRLPSRVSQNSPGGIYFYSGQSTSSPAVPQPLFAGPIAPVPPWSRTVEEPRTLRGFFISAELEFWIIPFVGEHSLGDNATLPPERHSREQTRRPRISGRVPLALSIRAAKKKGPGEWYPTQP